MNGNSLKSVFGIVLALLLAVTGQSMAVARGASAATGEMVICIGEQTKTVYVDAEGAPTAPPHLCPDCMLVFETANAFHPLVFDARISLEEPRNWSAPVSVRDGFGGFLSRAPPLLA